MLDERYKRQYLMDEIGEEGQKKLANSKALVIGAGGLGSPVLYYLAAAGVGTLGIVDRDIVELSNLNRQILHFTNDLGKSKAQSAKSKLQMLNPNVKINIYEEEICENNALNLLDGYDIVVDCVDNLSTRYIVNDACIKKGVTLIEAGVTGFEGYVMTIVPKKTPCLRCLFPQKDIKEGARPPIGIIGSTAGVAGTLQATEAIKQLLSIEGVPLKNVILINLIDMSFEKMKLEKNCNRCK